jgi:hypothetical protein
VHVAAPPSGITLDHVVNDFGIYPRPVHRSIEHLRIGTARRTADSPRLRLPMGDRTDATIKASAMSTPRRHALSPNPTLEA